MWKRRLCFLFLSLPIAPDSFPDLTAVSYQDAFWSYACRFLRVSFSLQAGFSVGISSALQDLRAISGAARSRGDDAISLVASTLEAQVHQLSSHHDALEHAQRALASARSLQLTDAAAQLPQLLLATQITDLLCSLKGSNPQQARAKMQELTATMEQRLADPRWSDDGTVHVAVKPGKTSDRTFPDGSGDDSPKGLILSWMSRRDVRILVNFLIGVTASQFGSSDPHLPEQCFHQALRMAEHGGSGNRTPSNTRKRSAHLV